MGQERFSDLSVIQDHYSFSFDYDKLLHDFALRYDSRKVEFFHKDMPP